MKSCTKCGATKPPEAFASNGRMGLHTSCKACQSNRARLARLTNPVEFKAREREQAKNQVLLGSENLKKGRSFQA